MRTILPPRLAALALGARRDAALAGEARRPCGRRLALGRRPHAVRSPASAADRTTLPVPEGLGRVLCVGDLGERLGGRQHQRCPCTQRARRRVGARHGRPVKRRRGRLCIARGRVRGVARDLCKRCVSRVGAPSETARTSTTSHGASGSVCGVSTHTSPSRVVTAYTHDDRPVDDSPVLSWKSYCCVSWPGETHMPPASVQRHTGCVSCATYHTTTVSSRSPASPRSSSAACSSGAPRWGHAASMQ